MYPFTLSGTQRPGTPQDPGLFLTFNSTPGQIRKYLLQGRTPPAPQAAAQQSVDVRDDDVVRFTGTPPKIYSHGGLANEATRQENYRFLMAHVVAPHAELNGYRDELARFEMAIQPDRDDLTAGRLAALLEPMANLRKQLRLARPEVFNLLDYRVADMTKTMLFSQHRMFYSLLSWLPADFDAADLAAHGAVEHAGRHDPRSRDGHTDRQDRHAPGARAMAAIAAIAAAADRLGPAKFETAARGASQLLVTEEWKDGCSGSEIAALCLVAKAICRLAVDSLAGAMPALDGPLTDTGHPLASAAIPSGRYGATGGVSPVQAGENPDRTAARGRAAVDAPSLVAVSRHQKTPTGRRKKSGHADRRSLESAQAIPAGSSGARKKTGRPDARVSGRHGRATGATGATNAAREDAGPASSRSRREDKTLESDRSHRSSRRHSMPARIGESEKSHASRTGHISHAGHTKHASQAGRAHRTAAFKETTPDNRGRRQNGRPVDEADQQATESLSISTSTPSLSKSDSVRGPWRPPGATPPSLLEMWESSQSRLLADRTISEPGFWIVERILREIGAVARADPGLSEKKRTRTALRNLMLNRDEIDSIPLNKAFPDSAKAAVDRHYRVAYPDETDTEGHRVARALQVIVRCLQT